MPLMIINVQISILQLAIIVESAQINRRIWHFCGCESDKGQPAAQSQLVQVSQFSEVDCCDAGVMQLSRQLFYPYTISLA